MIGLLKLAPEPLESRFVVISKLVLATPGMAAAELTEIGASAPSLETTPLVAGYPITSSPLSVVSCPDEFVVKSPERV